MQDALIAEVTDESPQPDHPEGQYAKLEMMGHRTLWGRISEVTVFGAAMLKIEAIVSGKMVGEVLTGPQSIYCLTKCSAAQAFANSPKGPGYDDTLRLLAPPRSTESDYFVPKHADRMDGDVDDSPYSDDLPDDDEEPF